ncbi:MAG: hypothetical protein HY738_17955 [Bacteroidia bacterium]|nr:hypothetical protein [Bacteroidia bacterium]
MVTHYIVSFVIGFIFSLKIGLSQQTFHIDDDNKLLHGFYNPNNYRKFDSLSEEFLLIKKNVLNYCDDNLKFDIDSIAASYFCREIISNTLKSTKKVKRIVKRNHLKYIFYISFKIRDSLYYHTSFILDTNLFIQYTPDLIFNINKEKIFNIIDWKDISNEIRAYKNGYIEPIYHINIKYNNKYKQFVYYIMQGGNKKSICINCTKNTSFFKYKVNLLIVSSITGEILEETTTTIIVHGQPSW